MIRASRVDSRRNQICHSEASAEEPVSCLFPFAFIRVNSRPKHFRCYGTLSNHADNTLWVHQNARGLNAEC